MIGISFLGHIEKTSTDGSCIYPNPYGNRIHSVECIWQCVHDKNDAIPRHSTVIIASYRIIPAICKKIVGAYIRVNTHNCVHTNKSPELRVIIAAIQVIKAGFCVVIIPSVAERILGAHGVASGVGDRAVAPGVVAVLGHNLSGSNPDNGDNIPLQVVEVVEQHSPVGKAHALAGAVVEEPHNGIPGLLRQDLAAVEEEFRGGAVDRLAGADTVSVVLIAVGVAAIDDLPQLPAHPGVAGAVVGEHVADAVVGDGLAVVLGQQVRPAAVAIGVCLGLQNLAQGAGCIGVTLYRQNVPGLAVGVDEGGVLCLAVVAGQLVFLVVGVLLPQGLGVVGGPDPLGGDVAGLVVRIVQVRNAQKPRVVGVVDAPDRGGGAIGVGGPIEVKKPQLKLGIFLYFSDIDTRCMFSVAPVCKIRPRVIFKSNDIQGPYSHIIRICSVYRYNFHPKSVFVLCCFKIISSIVDFLIIAIFHFSGNTGPAPIIIGNQLPLKIIKQIPDRFIQIFRFLQCVFGKQRFQRIYILRLDCIY